MLGKKTVKLINSMTIFQQIVKKKYTPYPAHDGELQGVCCEFKIWSVSSSTCHILCNNYVTIDWVLRTEVPSICIEGHI